MCVKNLLMRSWMIHPWSFNNFDFIFKRNSLQPVSESRCQAHKYFLLISNYINKTLHFKLFF